MKGCFIPLIWETMGQLKIQRLLHCLYITYSSFFELTFSMAGNVLHRLFPFWTFRQLGFIPNGARVYYSQRSQPPMLTSMVNALLPYLDAEQQWTLLTDCLPLLEREHSFWLQRRTVNVSRSGKVYQLARYCADSNVPRWITIDFKLDFTIIQCSSGLTKFCTLTVFVFVHLPLNSPMRCCNWEDFSKDCPGTRYGASPARNDCEVCVSRLICHLIFDFGGQTIHHCFVPRFSNGCRLSLSLSYQSFPLSSELRKHWSVALRRDEGANSCVSESTVRCSERFLRQIFTFLLAPKSLWTLPLPITAKQGRFVVSWKQMQCHRFFFFFCIPQVSVRRSPIEWAWTTKQRNARPWEKACSWLPLAKWWKHFLSKADGIASSCSASEVKFVQDQPIERPTHSVHARWLCQWR